MTHTTPQDVASRYIDAWNETDPVRRRALVAAVWTEDATYRDPLMQGNGHRDIEALIEGVQARFPSFRFALSGRPADGFNDQLRFSWDLGPADGDAVVQGTDFAVLADDGRLRSVTGFLDRVPAGAGD